MPWDAYAAALARAQTQGREVSRTFYPISDRPMPPVHFDMARRRYLLRGPAGSRPHIPHRADLCGPFGRTMP